MKSKQEELFDRFVNLKYRMQSLAGIVQNEVSEISMKEISEFATEANNAINELNKLTYDVFEFYNER